jgi:hypothetical protein
MKKNTRIEALMFLEFLGQMVAALIERELRQKMELPCGNFGLRAGCSGSLGRVCG